MSKKDRQLNIQKKRDILTNNDLQSITEKHEHHHELSQYDILISRTHCIQFNMYKPNLPVLEKTEVLSIHVRRTRISYLGTLF